MEVKERIARICEMEHYLDEGQEVLQNLTEALEKWEAVQEKLLKLFSYYGSPEWFSDLEADEKGDLPKELKRGVLSEDAVYDLICEWEALKKKIKT